MDMINATKFVGLGDASASLNGNCSIFRRFDIAKVLLGRLGLGVIR